MKNALAELSAFVTVARERSFTRAAARLGISQSALSHAMSALEKRLRVQLLARTTRSVSPTAAGAALMQELAPAFERIEAAVAETRNRRETPSGRIRLIIPRTATEMVILPKLAHFARAYPEIVLEVTSSNDPVDLVAGEYDAGIQLGEFIQRDMIAVRVTREMRLAVVGSPEYFKSNTTPKHPQDLKDHACVGFRFSNGLYKWELEKGRKTLTVSPQGPASFDDPELVIQAVLDAGGMRTAVAEPLTRLLAGVRWLQPLKIGRPQPPELFLFSPTGQTQPAALTALINTLRLI